LHLSTCCKSKLWHPNPCLNRIGRVLISTSYTFFSGGLSENNSRLIVLGLERYEDGWLTRSDFSNAHAWGLSIHERRGIRQTRRRSDKDKGTHESLPRFDPQRVKTYVLLVWLCIDGVFTSRA
jgi:hypothetical protein